MKSEGYNYSQIAKQVGVSCRTVKRLLCVNPEYMCVDGSQIRQSYKILDPYRRQIQELLERGFQTSQILVKLQETYPGIRIKRTTLSDFCVTLRAELFSEAKSTTEDAPALGEGSILFPYTDKISMMLHDNKPLTTIFEAIKAEGYHGSYSLLQQYCLPLKPRISRTRRAVHKVKRRDLTSAVWSGKAALSEQDMQHIETQYPILVEIKSIIAEFRDSYSQKDVDAVKGWCDKYAQCSFPAICSFINGISTDEDAFYNSIKYSYSNGLLEGSVNKLKVVKRSMFGRASYGLLRAKLLLTNRG